jgi:hypothetical protein
VGFSRFCLKFNYLLAADWSAVSKRKKSVPHSQNRTATQHLHKNNVGSRFYLFQLKLHDKSNSLRYQRLKSDEMSSKPQKDMDVESASLSSLSVTVRANLLIANMTRRDLGLDEFGKLF